MAEQDIKENAMSGGTPTRLRGLAANGNSISPTLEEVMNAMGIYTKKWDSNKGDLLEINAPYSIFIIGESVIGGHIMGVFANDITVLSKARQFSETKDQEGTINIYRKDEHSIIVQNNIEKMNIRILFLSSY
ncbi:hypothetical protein POZ03_18185 [Bacteroides uniformis]|uniref:hypothetical protein n=1 Tax=Bacteroides uniformis TaxID=820 RepID=UPI00233EECB6|nr:hypothetical protein [Bacteroides uniformis]MDC1812395.1 hypothetical protein [Bacteroides uniformis]